MKLKENWDFFFNRVSTKLMNHMDMNSTLKGMINHQAKKQEEFKVNSAKDSQLNSHPYLT